MKDKSNSHIVNALTHLISCGDIPDDPPLNPMDLLQEWYKHAEQCGQYANSNAMTIATSTLDGAPSARIVLCKCLETQPPALVFFTSYESRKGSELEANPRAAAVFHWPHAKRQARVEGVVERVSPQESDEYFSSRSIISRIGSSVSPQSQVMSSRASLVASAITLAGQTALAGKLPRPANWGGYRIHIRVVELWSAREGRLNDRVRWILDDSNSQMCWQVTRLGS